VYVTRTYWIDLFAIEMWKEFLDHGGDVWLQRETAGHRAED
jgi:hypothetical protein